VNGYSDSTPNNDNFTDYFLVRIENRAVIEVNEQSDQAFTLATVHYQRWLSWLSRSWFASMLSKHRYQNIFVSLSHDATSQFLWKLQIKFKTSISTHSAANCLNFIALNLMGISFPNWTTELQVTFVTFSHTEKLLT